MEDLHQASEGKVDRTKPHDGEDIRRINYEWIGRDAKNCRDRIDGKDDIGSFDHQQNNEERRRKKSSVFADKEVITVVIVGHRHKTPEEPENRVPFRVDLIIIVREHLDAGDDQEGTEDVDYPVKLLDQCNAGKNEGGTHKQRPDDSPEKDLVLVLSRDTKEGEDHQEDEEIVDAQRLLDQITGQELHGRHGAACIVDKAVEYQCERDPDSTPGESFAHLDCVRFAMKNPQVESQQAQNDNCKQNPQISLHNSFFSFTTTFGAGSRSGVIRYPQLSRSAFTLRLQPSIQPSK